MLFVAYAGPESPGPALHHAGGAGPSIQRPSRVAWAGSAGVDIFTDIHSLLVIKHSSFCCCLPMIHATRATRAKVATAPKGSPWTNSVLS